MKEFFVYELKDINFNVCMHACYKLVEDLSRGHVGTINQVVIIQNQELACNAQTTSKTNDL
jgi:hypothetical protein